MVNLGDGHGSYHALMAALETNLRALVHNWCVADLAKWFYEIEDSPEALYWRLEGTPKTRSKAYRNASPIAHVHGIRFPVLINHEKNDDYFSVRHSYNRV